MLNFPSCIIYQKMEERCFFAVESMTILSEESNLN